MKSQPSEPSETDKEREILLKQFRAYLHLAITAKQTGQDKEFRGHARPQDAGLLPHARQIARQHAGAGIGNAGRAILEQIDAVVKRFSPSHFSEKSRRPGKAGGIGSDSGAIGFGPGFHLAPGADDGQLPCRSHQVQRICSVMRP